MSYLSCSSYVSIFISSLFLWGHSHWIRILGWQWFISVLSKCCFISSGLHFWLKKKSYSDCFPIIDFPWLLLRSLGVRNLITMCLHMDFLGFILELHLEFTELHESLVSTCLCHNWDFFPTFFFFFFFLLCSYWIIPVDLALSCLFPMSFPIHCWVNPVNYGFQKSVCFHSILYTFSFFAAIFYLSICFKILHSHFLEKYFNSYFEVLVVPTSGLSWH